MIFKSIVCNVIFLMIICFTTKQDQVIAGELKRDYSKTHYSYTSFTSRASKGVYARYSHSVNRQNFSTSAKYRGINHKHIKFIEVASTGTFHELLFLHEEIKPRVNFRNNYGETALIKVLDRPYNMETFSKLKFLLSAGAGPNVRGRSSKSDNTTSLGVAIWNSREVFQSGSEEEIQIAQQVLELLIAAGADVSGVEVNGRSLLHLAAETNNLFAAKLLLESGLKVVPIDDNHKTPLDIAESGDMIKLLKEHHVKKVS